MIEPTGAYPSPESKVTTGKRQSIADFEYYAICQGQKQIGPIGYSPLPVNLVQAGFGQINKLKTAAPAISLTKETILNCTNPTFVEGQPNTNYLATIAPLPPACDQTGAGPCASTVTPNGLGSNPTSSGSYGNSAASHPTSSAAAGTTSGTAAAGTSAAASGTASGAAAGRRARGRPTAATTDGGIDPGDASGIDVGRRHRYGQPGRLGILQLRRATDKYDSTVLPGYGISSLLARFGLLVVVLLLVVFRRPGRHRVPATPEAPGGRPVRAPGGRPVKRLGVVAVALLTAGVAVTGLAGTPADAVGSNVATPAFTHTETITRSEVSSNGTTSVVATNTVTLNVVGRPPTCRAVRSSTCPGRVPIRPAASSPTRTP